MEVKNKMEEYQLRGKIILKGKIVVKTGLAIGGSKTSLDIGGMDNPVIKDSKGVPYIPGSTIKGKIRSILESSLYPLRSYKKDDYELNDGKGFFDSDMIIHRFGGGDREIEAQNQDPIIKIFGLPEIEAPVRGIFRDSYLDLEHFENNKKELFKNLELDFTEDKMENTVDRISAKANPRHLERVPSGANFNFEIILGLYSDDDKPLLKVLFQGLKLLEDDYLGGSGTRGSGKIAFKGLSIVFRSIEFYSIEKEESILVDQFNLKDIKNEEWFTNVFSKINL